MFNIDLQCTITAPRPRQKAGDSAEVVQRDKLPKRVRGVRVGLRLGPDAPGGMMDLSLTLVYE